MQNKYEKLARKEKESVINQREEKSSKVMGRKVKVCRSLSEKTYLWQASIHSVKPVMVLANTSSTLCSPARLSKANKSKFALQINQRFCTTFTVFYSKIQFTSTFSFSDLSGSCNRPLSQSSRNHTSFFNKQI